MSNGLVNVFVYGTLRMGEINHNVVKGFITHSVTGTIKGTLYNVSDRYPALILDNEGFEVEGEWLVVDNSALKEMDRLEGYHGPGKDNFYERVWVKDLHSDYEGWVYVWEYPSTKSVKYPVIPSGDWKNRFLHSFS